MKYFGRHEKPNRRRTARTALFAFVLVAALIPGVASVSANGSQPPVADPNGPYSGVAGEAIQFDGSGSVDGDGTIVAYDWDFGDGAAGTGVSPTHAYASGGTFIVTLTVTDELGLTDTAATTATIASPPVANDDAYSTDEDTVLNVVAPGVLSNDTDADGDPITAVLMTGTSNGALTLNANGSFTYAPDPDFYGTDTFTYVANDGLYDSNEATVTITVNSVNDPPSADPNGPYVGTAGVPILFDGSGSVDGDGTIVAYDWDFGDLATGTGVGPTHTYAASGTFIVTLTVTDDGGATDTATTTATIANRPPVAVDDAYTTDEDTVLNVVAPGVFVNDYDADGDPISSPGWTYYAPFNAEVIFYFDGSFKYTPDPDFCGTSRWTYYLTDGTADSNWADVTITVNCVNDPPTADANGPYVGDEGSPIMLDASGSSDPDGDPLTYGWSVDDASLCTFDDPTAVMPNLTCTDNGGFTVTVVADDGNGLFDSATAAVLVSNVAPVVTLTNDPLPPAPEGAPTDAVEFIFTDPGDDSHDLTCWWSDGVALTLPNVTSPYVCPGRFFPAGIYTVTVEVTDDDGGTGSATTSPIAVYDASDGFVTGGGWIDSPPGALYPEMNAHLGGNTYELFYTGDTWLYWDEAKAAAEAMTTDSCAAHLATITSAEEQAVIAALMGPLTLNAWIGGYQEDDELGTNVNWKWVNGDIWGYTNWAGGEPNDNPWGTQQDGSEQHLEVYQGSGLWNDAPGTVDAPLGGEGKHFYIVEYEDCDPRPTGKATFGFVSKYKKGATVPTGSTEFQFHAAGLNFHSNSYEWLLVTGSDYAKFKGTGTINGDIAPTGEMYKFKIWAGDDDPDTFRIKIWYEDDAGFETVIYDNGFDQELGAGSIVIHTKGK